MSGYFIKQPVINIKGFTICGFLSIEVNYRSERLAAPQLVVMTAWCERDEEWALRGRAIRYNGAKKLSSLERTRYGAQRSQARGYRETESFFDPFSQSADRRGYVQTNWY